MTIYATHQLHIYGFADVGVVGGCGDLCSLLAQKTNSSIAGTVCELLCDVTGIEEFIKVIQK